MSQEKKKKQHQEIAEQQEVLKNTKKNMLVSASAGSGKTYVMIEYVTQLVCDKKVPVKKLLVLTFTKAAATEMKERLLKKLKSKGSDPFVLEQIDSLTTANICTIDSFCEKMLKKFSNIVGVPSNFEIMDEGLEQKLSGDAFERAVETFQAENNEDWKILVDSFKNDKSKIREIVLEIEQLLQSLADKEGFLKENFEKSQMFFDKACNFLFETFKIKVQNALEECQKLHVADFEIELKTQLQEILCSKDLFELEKAFVSYKAPRRPNCEVVGQEVFDKLDVVKAMIGDVQNKLKELKLSDAQHIENQKNAELEKKLFLFYDVYQSKLKEMKLSLNCLSFGDLEDYMEKLSKQTNLFGDFSYVFVDEYQDTNKIQERIVKNVAKNCNFIAVGDAKQGIYGFRNASAEIFLKDMAEFSANEDSSVKFLKSNFRSCKNVLNFVNDIFKVCMTQDSCGIDYLNGSMLDGKGEFVDDGVKSVHIDLLEADVVEKEAVPYLYSVQEASTKVKNKHQKMLKDIKRRIIEVMSSQISDDGQLRDCKYSDIAILSRNRDELFNELALYLQESGIPVISNSRSKLAEEVEILVLINWLKLALSLDDEVALLSVLTSALCSLSFESIAEEKIANGKGLCEIVKEDANEKFKKFNQNLQKFRKNSLIYGIKAAFLQLFEDTNYRAYINLHNEKVRLNLFVDKFLEEISASGFDRDLAGLLNYFESVEIVVSSEATMAEDGVLLTTIHNSKGLEYPVVFLINCDKDVMKEPFKKGYVEINETFGVALKNYDQETNQETLTVKMQAIKMQEASKILAEELMIFYVALTRAKNRLYLFGEYKKSIFEKLTVFSCKSYCDFVFFAMKDAKDKLKENDVFETENVEISKIEDVVEKEVSQEKIYKNIEKNPIISQKLQEYLNFQYDLSEKENYSLKESVTSLTHKNKENELEKFSNETISFSPAGVEIGNAYHLALKVLDFAKIEDEATLDLEIEKNMECLSDSVGLIDKKILLGNILRLKKFTLEGRVVKEKEFIMKDRLSNLLEDCSLDEKIIVQGIVDLFVVQDDGIVLIDYKYSNSNSEEYLLKNYRAQILLYKTALESFFKKPVKEAYLLSLKNFKLIKVC